MVPGQITTVAFSLFATSAEVPRGHRLRIALAGADADMFVPRPAAGPIEWRVHRSAAHPSHVVLPIKPQD